MGNTTVAIGPVPTDLVTIGQSIGDLRTIAALNNIWVPLTIVMSNSYATGGDTFAIPSNPPLVSGFKVMSVVLSPPKNGANWYTWNGSTSTPKIQAWSAFNTEVTAATDLSAVTLTGFCFMVS